MNRCKINHPSPEVAKAKTTISLNSSMFLNVSVSIKGVE
jgi:hypothetical protein